MRHLRLVTPDTEIIEAAAAAIVHDFTRYRRQILEESATWQTRLDVGAPTDPILCDVCGQTLYGVVGLVDHADRCGR